MKTAGWTFAYCNSQKPCIYIALLFDSPSHYTLKCSSWLKTKRICILFPFGPDGNESEFSVFTGNESETSVFINKKVKWTKCTNMEKKVNPFINVIK